MTHSGNSQQSCSDITIKPDATAMAIAFSKKLTEALLLAQLESVIRANRAEENVMVCHSHDCLDANELMYEVFQDCELDIYNDDHHRFWNEAWDIAKKNEFFHKINGGQ